VLPPPATGAAAVRGRLLARLAPGVTAGAALAEIGPIVRTIRQHGPDVRYALVHERDEVTGPVRPALIVLAAAVAVLLLIACLNVANLLLARALARHRELSVRAAVGASPGRLVRQCLTDSALLGLLGGLAGVALAAAGVAAFRTLATALPRVDLTSSGPGWGGSAFPRMHEIQLDGAALAFAAATAIATGIAVGLAAAVRSARADGFATIRRAGATAASRRSRPRQGLVVLQVAGATTLLVCAVLLTRSLQHLLSVETGYVTDDVVTFQVALPSARYPDAELRRFAETLTERLRALPQVETAAYANQLPLVQLRDTAGGLWTTPDPTRRGAPDGADARFVSRDYLDALGIRVLAGRGFTAGDGAGQPRVLLVNQALARRQFPGADPLGRRVYVGRDPAPWTIVGVVGDVRQFGLDRPAEPQFFADLRQWTGGMPLFPAGAYYVVKVRRPPRPIADQVRAAAAALDAEASVFNVAPLAALVADSVARPRLYASIVVVLAAVGALLAGIGLYGVVAFLVQTRTAEFGIRRALGASAGRLLSMVLAEGAALVGIGLVLGIAGAAALARMLDSLLFGFPARDPAASVTAAALFAGIAAVAVLIPARRATRVDPLTAIRVE
jgi:putative ABC transport system permease protein